MNKSRTRTIAKIIALACIGGAAVMVFLMFGPPKLLAKSESPDFCSQCHVMGAQYEAWSHMGAHMRKLCVDCHLPHGNLVIHYIWKSIDGLKDVVFFYSGSVPERIKLTAHGKKVLQANCIRCHESAVEFIDHERKCWECHRGLIHTRSGSMETI
jgi:cytochrome c nitrite reductase small subunit